MYLHRHKTNKSKYYMYIDILYIYLHAYIYTHFIYVCKHQKKKLCQTSQLVHQVRLSQPCDQWHFVAIHGPNMTHVDHLMSFALQIITNHLMLWMIVNMGPYILIPYRSQFWQTKNWCSFASVKKSKRQR